MADATPATPKKEWLMGWGLAVCVAFALIAVGLKLMPDSPETATGDTPVAQKKSELEFLQSEPQVAHGSYTQSARTAPVETAVINVPTPRIIKVGRYTQISIPVRHGVPSPILEIEDGDDEVVPVSYWDQRFLKTGKIHPFTVRYHDINGDVVGERSFSELMEPARQKTRVTSRRSLVGLDGDTTFVIATK